MLRVPFLLADRAADGPEGYLLRDCISTVFWNRTVPAPPCFSSKSFNESRTLQTKPLHWGTNLLFGETLMGQHWFLVFVSSNLCYLVSFQQNSSVAALTVLPLNGWELVICFYLEQLSPVHKAARLLWNVPRVHFLVMLRVKTDAFPKGSKCFQRQMSGFNCKNKFPAWTQIGRTATVWSSREF